MVENGKLYNRIYKERNGKMASSNLKDNLEKLQIVAKERTVKTQNIEYDLETLVKKIKKIYFGAQTKFCMEFYLAKSV